MTETGFMDDMQDSTVSRVRVLFILAVIFAGYLFMASRATLWDRDEPRFCRATVEMIQSGNYLYPTFNGHLRPDKPILIYWLMSLPIRILGPTSLACRFFSVVGITLSCWLTYLIGRKLYNDRVGLWAMQILATSLMVMVIGTLATADAILLPCMLAVMAIFVYRLERQYRWRDIVFTGLALGLALLAKGPVGLLVIVVIGVILLLGRKLRSKESRYFLPLSAGVALGVGVFIAWAIPANQATGGEFLRQGIGHHVLQRSASPLENHGGNFLLFLPYYIPVVLVGFFPWTLHLPGTISALLGKRGASRWARVILLGWSITIFVFMTLVATKLPHYILFIWPALALAVAGVIREASRGKLSKRDMDWLRGGIWFLGPMAAVGVLGFMIGPWVIPRSGFRLSGMAAGIILAAMTVWALKYQLHNKPLNSAKVLIFGMIVFQIPFLLGVIPAIENRKISPHLARILRKDYPAAEFAVYKYGEPSLNFYLAKPVTRFGSLKEAFAWLQNRQNRVLVLPEKWLKTKYMQKNAKNWKLITTTVGFNFSKGNELKISAITGN